MKLEKELHIIIHVLNQGRVKKLRHPWGLLFLSVVLLLINVSKKEDGSLSLTLQLSANLLVIADVATMLLSPVDNMTALLFFHCYFYFMRRAKPMKPWMKNK